MHRGTHFKFAALLAVGVLLVFAATASASYKPYSLVISPQSPAYTAGGETVTITATLHNENTTQQLGSSDLMAPSGFTVTAASAPAPASATPVAKCTITDQNGGSDSGPCVQLRGLSLPPGGTVTVTMTVQTPACVAPGSSWLWLIETKQANNFSGQPGNDLTLDTSTSSPTTTLDGACQLAFSTEPADAVVNQPITGTAWDPSGPPVAVQVLDASGNPVPTSTAPVSVILLQNPGAATLSGTLTQNASAGTGIASFGDLSVNEPAAGYALLASSGTLHTASSTTFAAATTAAQCAANASCMTDVSAHGNNLQVVANAGSQQGLLLESVNENNGASLSCKGYTEVDANTYSFLTTVDRSKVLTVTVSTPDTHLSGSAAKILHGVQFCFGAPYDFTTSAGTLAPAGTLPDGTSGFIGLLPNCPATGPCIDRKSDHTIPDPSSPLGFDIVVLADVPSGLPGDPIGRL